MNLEKLLSPGSIAVLGASEEAGKVGNVVSRNILELGYAGEIYLVNPKYDTLFGRKCNKNLSEIENPVDLAVIAIPAKFVLDEIKNNAERIKNYVIISAGFSEAGEEGKAREAELQKLAGEYDLNVLGPNCLGFIAPEAKLNASFAGGMPETGNIAFVSQSGALAVAVMDAAKEKGLKFSKVVSIGNKAVLSETEMLEYLEKDENTKVIGIYLEGIKDGRKFMEMAARVSRAKPVVILKAGTTEKSQMAISSHTGALAGSDEIISAVFEKTGVIRAENLEEFFDLLRLISFSPAPKNNKAVVITNAGGPGVLATDAFRDKNITLSEISEKTKTKLRKYLPAEASVENPIDLLGDAREDRYRKVLEIIHREMDPGNIISILTPQDQTPVARIASKIISFQKKTGANVATSFVGGEKNRKAVKKLGENNICNFEFPERAIVSLDKYFSWKSKEYYGTRETEIRQERKAKVSQIINKARSDGRNALYFRESREIMEMYGINTAESYEAGTAISNFPVVLKVDSDKVLHKTDKKGLVLDIKNQEELEKNTAEMKKNFPGENLIIQPMMARQTELIVGIKYDQIFGPVIACGLGGVYTEIFKTVDFFMPPLTLEEIKIKLLKSKIKFLFEETRGQKKYDLEELANILWGISYFALEAESVKEFDINPLLVYNNGEKAAAVDVKIIL